jgi:hypothetical protein
MKKTLENLIPFAVGAVLVAGVIFLLRWSFKQKAEGAIKLIQNTPLYSDTAQTGKVYKFYGKINCTSSKELPGKREKVVWGYLNLTTEYGAPGGELVVGNIFCYRDIGKNPYIEINGKEKLPVYFGEQHYIAGGCQDDVYNETKIFLAHQENINSEDFPEELKVESADDPETPQYEFKVIYGKDEFPFYREQIKFFNKGVTLRKKYILPGEDVVIIGTLTEEGIKGTPEEPVHIYAGTEEEVLAKLKEKSEKMTAH